MFKQDHLREIVKRRESALGCDKADIVILPVIADLSNQIFIHVLPEIQKCQLEQNNYFLPHINLLTLRCFVAEVRWLFPLNCQK